MKDDSTQIIYKTTPVAATDAAFLSGGTSTPGTTLAIDDTATTFTAIKASLTFVALASPTTKFGNKVDSGSDGTIDAADTIKLSDIVTINPTTKGVQSFRVSQ